jgi:hypothetical protein
MNDEQKARIREALASPDFTWRGIEALSDAADLSVGKTRAVLAELAADGVARRSRGEKEVYGLIERVGQ